MPPPPQRAHCPLQAADGGTPWTSPSTDLVGLHGVSAGTGEQRRGRTRRIAGLTASGGSVGVLWKKSATSTQLSLFDLDPGSV